MCCVCLSVLLCNVRSSANNYIRETDVVIVRPVINVYSYVKYTCIHDADNGQYDKCDISKIMLWPMVELSRLIIALFILSSERITTFSIINKRLKFFRILFEGFYPILVDDWMGLRDSNMVAGETTERQSCFWLGDGKCVVLNLVVLHSLTKQVFSFLLYYVTKGGTKWQVYTTHSAGPSNHTSSLMDLFPGR